MELTDQKLQEMFNKYTVPLNDMETIRGLNYDTFKVLVAYIEMIAYHKGMNDGMDKLAGAVEASFKLESL